MPKAKDTPIVGVILTDDAYEYVKQQSALRSVPIAVVVREAIAEHAARRGVIVRSQVQWGGGRRLPTPQQQ
ncbi:MAG: hypothetical protein KatS3mg051_1923 [Anaerolineae bacterium]|nr:MAG: hypothetical protein KatS3mg051_1923 [Anaerolineae bacterium]